jgi:F-type H+-transporting ATPase subunit gamma
MASAREMRLRIRSVDNIAQVTRALQAISASRVRRAIQAVAATRPYATRAWQVLLHLASQPAHQSVHALLTQRSQINRRLVVLVTGDRGLAGAYNTNVVRLAMTRFAAGEPPVGFVVIGRKGRDMLVRRGVDLRAEFSHLPANPIFADISPIGRLVVDEYLEGRADQVFIVYTDFVNMLSQVPTVKQLLPLEVGVGEGRVVDYAATSSAAAAYIYEPGQTELIGAVVPRFTALQLYQAVLESLASEHAARMVAMQNATQNAKELSGALRLEYNKARQQAITGDILDIVGGVEALS